MAKMGQMRSEMRRTEEDRDVACGGLDASNSRPIEIEVGVTEPPQSAEIECDNARLDNAGTEIEISNVRIDYAKTAEEEAVLGDRSIEVIFDYHWVTQGDPAPQQCHITIYDRLGKVVLETPASLAHSSREFASGTDFFKLTLPDSADQLQPDSASLACDTMG